MAAMQDECTRIREEREAKQTGADPSRPMQPGAEPFRPSRRDPAVRAAAQERHQRRQQERLQARQQPWQAGPGYCDACSATGRQTWEESRRQCGLCMRAICNWHSVPGWALCWDCDPGGSERRADHPAIVPQRPRPSKCDYCTGEPYGPCYRCNRWLCDACRIEQEVACCVECPAVIVPTGGLTGVSLKLTLTAHRPGQRGPRQASSHAQPPREHAPPHAQPPHEHGPPPQPVGRTSRMGGWHEASRRKSGMTHVVGQSWKRRRDASESAPRDDEASGSK